MNIYFLCLTQYINVGDLLINKMLVDEFCRYGTVYVDCPDAPSDFKHFILENPNTINVNTEFNQSIKSINLVKTLNFFKKKHINLFLQSPGPIKKGKTKVSSLYLRFLHSILLKSGIPFYRIGNCCSNLMSQGLEIHFNHVTAIYVRSKDAVEYLKSMGNKNVYYIPDLAYLFHYKVQQSEKEKKAIISFREIKDNEGQFLSWLKGTISTLQNKGYSIEMYFQVKSDQSFMQHLYDEIDDDTIIFRKELVWYDSFDYYKDKSLVISNRLHSLLLGVVHGSVPVAYNDGNALTSKIGDVFSSSLCSYDKYLVTSSSQQQITYILDHLDDCRCDIQNSCEYNAELCRNTINKIVSDLKS